MTINEFKAWLDGYTEAMGDKPPTKAQWARIKEKMSEVQEHHCWHRPYWTWSYTCDMSKPLDNNKIGNPVDPNPYSPTVTAPNTSSLYTVV